LSTVVFGPATTVTDDISYADILVLAIALLGFVLLLPRIVIMLLLAWQVANFFLLWALFEPGWLPLPDNTRAQPELHWPTLLAALICATAMIRSCLRVAPSSFVMADSAPSALE
jgi:hypothetical protein